jgi:ferredoxin
MKNANAVDTPPLSTLPAKITLNDSVILYKDSDKTLLECLEEEKYEIHYHCRDGYCGACRITLNNGEIDYFNGEPLAYVGKGEILPCCCKPKGDIDITLI